MKRLLSILSAIVLFASCDRSNEVELIIGNPSERISDTLDYVRSALVEAPNGWVAYTTTDRSGGYGFYFDFGDDNRVSMIADVTNQAAAEIRESTYRVRQIMSTTLVFDTYNYITMLQDPDPGTLGGAAGVGLGSDIEYEYIRTSGDTLLFRGRRFEKNLVLVRATAQQQQAYLAGSYNTIIQEIVDYTSNTPYFYIQPIENGPHIQVTILSDKFISLVWEEDGVVKTLSAPFAFTLDGMVVLGTLEYQGILITHIIWDSQTGLTAISSSGSPYAVQVSDDPILPVFVLLGESINQLVLPGPYSFQPYLPLSSWSASFINSWEQFLNLARTQGYNLTIGNAFYDFVKVNNRINVTMTIYQGSNAFTATLRYNYNIDEEGLITFSNFASTNGNGDILVPYFNSSLNQRLLADRFSMDYGSDPSFGRLILFTSVENPDYYFSMVVN